jgi:hypothetical protein
MTGHDGTPSGEPSAARAAGHLIHIGILEIRTMAATHQVLAVGSDANPQSPYDTEYSARIHMIADVCHELTAAFLEENAGARESVAAAALSYRWSAAAPEARRWMRSRLAQLGEEYVGLLA